MHPLDQEELEGEWTYRLGDMQLSADIIGSIEARTPLPLARARSQPPRRAAALGQLAGDVETRELRPRKPAVRALLPAYRARQRAALPRQS